MSALHIFSAILTLSIFVIMGIRTGKQVKSSTDFDTGGKQAGTLTVTGNIIGTLVGGSSTIGTAQLAYGYGLSAWWFTLGASMGCLILALLFVKPLRKSGFCTITKIITNEFGETTGFITSILSIIGLTINIIAQILAANALMSTIFGFEPIICAAISILLMFCYVLGGVKSTGSLGIIKTVLLYFSVLVGGYICLKFSGGNHVFYNKLPHEQFFSLFARGVGTDLGAAISVVLGVLSTQTYIQAIISARSNQVAKRGALLCTALIPFVGIGSILIGYYMRIHVPNMEAGQVFPRFVMESMNPVFGGIVLATLLIAIVGTGAGTALGLGTTFAHDIYRRFVNQQADEREILTITRITIWVVMVIAALLTLGKGNGAILKWGFLSMGLRAVVLLIPLCAALFFRGKLTNNIAILSCCAGLIVMIYGSVMNFPYDPLLAGMLTSLIISLMGASYLKIHAHNIDKKIKTNECKL